MHMKNETLDIACYMNECIVFILVRLTQTQVPYLLEYSSHLSISRILKTDNKIQYSHYY